MPKNGNLLRDMEERLKKINQYFLGRRVQMNYQSIKNNLWKEGLIEEYSYRSFNRDIQFLKERLNLRYPSLEEEFGNLLKYSVSNKSYYYIRDDISAFPSLSETEMGDIAQAISMNKHLFFDGLGEGLINKLKAIQLENNLNKFQNFIRWPTIQLIKDGSRSGEEWIHPLMESIIQMKPIKLSHKGLKSGSRLKKILAIPLMLKEYNNGWYTGWYLVFQPISFDDRLVRLNMSGLWVFALDRIRGIESIDQKFSIRIPDGFNPADFFKDNLGIYPKGHQLRPEKIILKIRETSWIKIYLQKYPLHGSQSIKFMNSDYFLVEYLLEINTELENFIWENIREIEVLEPIYLREAIKLDLIKLVSLLNI